MIIPVKTKDSSYDIILERGALKNAGKLISIGSHKALIVTDSGVPEQYAKTVADSLENAFIHVFPQGEASKNFDVFKTICQHLLAEGFSRKDCVIAVGGGVTGDMAGFAAACYMRGIDFYNIPTTLLSQVDSSIGGKTAIDLDGIKNIIGAFYQPKKVIIDPNVLETLPERQVSNGLAEAIKAGIIADESLFELFETENYMDNIDKIIEKSLLFKRGVVEQDEKEAGLRKVLNFGHTIGHGIESSAGLHDLYHGECVALGMIPMCSEKIKQRVIAALENVGLPTSFDYDKQAVFEALTHDKKASGKNVTIVKCDEIGSFRFEETDVQSLKALL
ncbi:MAG: 3-dehydroquinate synthase [Faecalibacterium sp.]|nr:3-dehydroquinate synthase [Ruminococcus sp.]MCM1393222.1 3-dehydroquinate synthase [Ruminococcus sp.]MCM1485334.1 3-dehydroquinate synthase [Faecalibacterium sp.]